MRWWSEQVRVDRMWRMAIGERGWLNIRGRGEKSNKIKLVLKSATIASWQIGRKTVKSRRLQRDGENAVIADNLSPGFSGTRRR
jgi:hypothetical protein